MPTEGEPVRRSRPADARTRRCHVRDGWSAPRRIATREQRPFQHKKVINMKVPARMRRNPVGVLLGWLFFGLPGLLFATRRSRHNG